MLQAHRFISAALAEILRNAPMSPEKISFAWRAAVGPTMGRGTAVWYLDRGVLRVRVDSVAWRREVERSEALIRTRLEALLGRGIVRAIEVAPDPTSNQQR